MLIATHKSIVRWRWLWCESVRPRKAHANQDVHPRTQSVPAGDCRLQRYRERGDGACKHDSDNGTDSEDGGATQSGGTAGGRHVLARSAQRRLCTYPGDARG